MNDSIPGLEGLLEPSLAADPVGTPIFSARASFLVAFFGGAFAILIFSALNSNRLGRLVRDTWLYAVLGIVVAGTLGTFSLWNAEGNLPDWLGLLGEGSRGIRRASQLSALLIFALFYSRHRRFLKAQALSGSEAPSPWIPGLVAGAAGVVLTMLCAYLGIVLGADATGIGGVGGAG